MNYLAIKDLTDSLNISKSTIYRWINQGRFPEPIRFSEKIVRWKLESVEEWEDKLKGKTEVYQ